MESAKVTSGGRRSRRHTRKHPRSQRVNNWAKEAGKYYQIHKDNDPEIKEFSDVLKSPKFKEYYHSKYGSGESKERFSKTRKLKKEQGDEMEEPMRKGKKEADDWGWGWDSDTKKFKKDEKQEYEKEERFQKDELFQGGKKNKEEKEEIPLEKAKQVNGGKKNKEEKEETPLEKAKQVNGGKKNKEEKEENPLEKAKQVNGGKKNKEGKNNLPKGPEEPEGVIEE